MKITKKLLMFILTTMIVTSTVFTINVQAAKLYKKDAAIFRREMKNQLENHYAYDSITKFTLYDLNGDGRKDLIISPCYFPAGSSEPLCTYIVMKAGKKYVSKKMSGEFVKAGRRSLLLEYSVTTCTKEWVQGKGRGYLDRRTLFKISKRGKIVLKAEYRHEKNYSSAPFTTSYNDGNKNNIGVEKYNKLIKKAKLKKLSFKKMTYKNIKKVK